MIALIYSYTGELSIKTVTLGIAGDIVLAYVGFLVFKAVVA